MDSIFRPIRIEDRADIAAISRATWEGDDFLEQVFESWVRDAASHFIGLEANGRIIGCARLLPLDGERIWLEGLRVLPTEQGRGLGRAMAHHTFDLSLELGFRTLLFSTYFGNTASIRISELAGFRPVATFSMLELKLDELTATSIEGTSLTPGFRRLPGWNVNDWLFLPADLARPERFLVSPALVSDGTLTMLLDDSRKHSGSALEICAMAGPPDAPPGACLAAAAIEARRRGRDRLHLMLPEERPLAPYREAGFRSYERSLDVFVYEAHADELRLAVRPREA